MLSPVFSASLTHHAVVNHTSDQWNERILQVIFESGAVDFFDFETIPENSWDAASPVNDSRVSEPRGWERSLIQRMSPSLMARLLLIQTKRAPNKNRILFGLNQALGILEHGTECSREAVSRLITSFSTSEIISPSERIYHQTLIDV